MALDAFGKILIMFDGLEVFGRGGVAEVRDRVEGLGGCRRSWKND